MTTTAPEPFGIYPARRAGALAGVSGRTIGQWARHHLVTPSIYEGRPANLYGYFDVAEAIVVRWLLNQKFSHADIRDALSNVRRDYPKWPLLNAPMGVGKASVDDRGLLVRKERDHYVAISGPAPGQMILRPELLDAARDMLRSGGWIARSLGLTSIEIVPGKLGGQPSLKGRRWAVDHVARLAADPEGFAVLVADYKLERAEVREAVQWYDAAQALA